jgi:hypothetical protein
MIKKEIDTIDAVPSKRLFLSIIADYGLNRSVCELIDNAIDMWVLSGKKKSLIITITLNKDQQTIEVSDNAGGVEKSKIHFLVGPGQTSNLETDKSIGIFGVGTKRAVVALAQDIKISTRYKKHKTYRVEYDDDWLKTEDWTLPLYEIGDISEGMTVIELQKLRFSITDEAISQLKEHLEVTYARFLRNKKLNILLGPDKLKPHLFEGWSYPQKYHPRKYTGKLKTEGGSYVDVEVLAGLSKESSPTGGEYGVYFYCNDRLITRGLKTYDVGFTRGLAGQPHPSISLARIIVSLKGEAKSMPWNSSKSEIQPNHHVFIALRSWLVQVVKDYTSLSRRLEGKWHEEVFKYSSGGIETVEIKNFPEARKSFLPPLPKSKQKYGDLIQQANRRIVENKPWAKGICESIVAVDLIYKKNLDQKNRICLLLIDSTLEIAFKEYLVNDSAQHYSNKRLYGLFQNRHTVHSEMKKYINLTDKVWKKINYYYDLRCKLVHERATIGISDSQIEDYGKIVNKILKLLFGLKL